MFILVPKCGGDRAFSKGDVKPGVFDANVKRGCSSFLKSPLVLHLSSDCRELGGSLWLSGVFSGENNGGSLTEQSVFAISRNGFIALFVLLFTDTCARNALTAVPAASQ